MKKTLFTALIGFCTACNLSAEDLYFAGGVSADNWWENAGNWRVGSADGEVSATKPTADDVVYIGSSTSAYQVKIGNNAGTRTLYGYTINIATGSSFTLDYNDYKLWGSTITVGGAEGLVFNKAVWGDYKSGVSGSGSQPLTLNLGKEGSVVYNAEFNSPRAANINITGELSILAGGDYSVQTRTLMDFASTQSADLSSFTSISTTFTGGTLSNTALEATAENVGKYWLVYDTVNKNLNVAYVTGNAAIPEPATATLSLLALASLAARRRRK